MGDDDLDPQAARVSPATSIDLPTRDPQSSGQPERTAQANQSSAFSCRTLLNVLGSFKALKQKPKRVIALARVDGARPKQLTTADRQRRRLIRSQLITWTCWSDSIPGIVPSSVYAADRLRSGLQSLSSSSSRPRTASAH